MRSHARNLVPEFLTFFLFLFLSFFLSGLFFQNVSSVFYSGLIDIRGDETRSCTTVDRYYLAVGS